jgi:cell division protein FtsW (lipid II flippase)
MMAYVPLLDPINALQPLWYLLLLPLAFGISVIYKAMRMPRLDRFWRQVALMTTQIVLAMIGLALCLVVLVQVLIPLIPLE